MLSLPVWKHCEDPSGFFAVEDAIACTTIIPSVWPVKRPTPSHEVAPQPGP